MARPSFTLVAQRRAERLDLAGVIAARDTEDHPATSQDVGHRVVFRRFSMSTVP